MTPIARSPLRHRVEWFGEMLRALLNVAFGLALWALVLYVFTSPLVLAVVLFRLSVAGCR